MVLDAYIDIATIAEASLSASGLPVLRRRAIRSLGTIGESAELVLITRPAYDGFADLVVELLGSEDVVFASQQPAGTIADIISAGAASEKPITVFWWGDDAPAVDVRGGRVVNVAQIGWREAATRLYNNRTAEVDRKTTETSIRIRLDLDGNGAATISTGLGFFDHMLEQLARHARMDLAVDVQGDLHVDEHHTIEDTAIALGQALLEAIGDKKGIDRYAFVLPMDDSLARVAFDWSGRAWLVWEADFRREKIGDVPTEMFYHFFKSLSDAARCNLNVAVTGENEHHMIESVFKAVGRCIEQASRRRPGDTRVPSTKGRL